MNLLQRLNDLYNQNPDPDTIAKHLQASIHKWRQCKHVQLHEFVNGTAIVLAHNNWARSGRVENVGHMLSSNPNDVGQRDNMWGPRSFRAGSRIGEEFWVRSQSSWEENKDDRFDPVVIENYW